MKKNNIFRILSMMITSVLLVFTSCTDLEEKLLDEANIDDLVENPENLPALVSPVYASLRPLSAFWDIWGLSEATTDECMFPTRGSDWDDGGNWRALHRHTWSPTHEAIRNAWNSLSQGTARAGVALYYLNIAEETPEVRKNIAEVRFLRAFYAYYFMDLFGQVPFRSEESIDFTVEAEVKTRTEAFEWIAEELLAILPDLGDKSTEPYGQITKAAAHTLLAKIYLNKEVYTGEADWPKVIEYCNEVINSGFYDINPDYFEIFEVDNHQNYENDDEAILVSIFDNGLNLGNNRSWSHFVLHYNQDLGMSNFNPWNGAAVPPDFLEKFDAVNDNRYQDDRILASTGVMLGFLIGQQYKAGTGEPLKTRTGANLIFTPEVPLQGAQEHQGVRVLKYEPDVNATTDATWMGNDFVHFRISDVYLMRAEAHFRNNDPDLALDDINTLREIRGLSPLTSLTLDDILDERGFELYWEGHRRQDLIRFGKFENAWHEKPASDKNKYLFPIPQSAIDVSTKLEQNEGYD